MLSKLIKHEFKSTGRYILMLIIALAAVTPLTALYVRIYTANYFDNVLLELFFMLAIMIFVIAIIGCFSATFIILLYRFYKSMISKEAYLTHTLPVKKSLLVMSKIIVASVWHIVTLLVSGFSIVVFILIIDNKMFSEMIKSIKYALNDLSYYFDLVMSPSTIILVIIAFLISVLLTYSQMFFAFSIGQRLTNHPILGTVITTMVYRTAVQIISFILLAIGAFVWNIDMVYSLFEHVSNVGLVNMRLGFSILSNVALLAITYLVSVHMFKKKLNI